MNNNKKLGSDSESDQTKFFVPVLFSSFLYQYGHSHCPILVFNSGTGNVLET